MRFLRILVLSSIFRQDAVWLRCFQQLSYIYATMDDMQKRSLDTCTKDYLERILRLKPEFSEGLQGLAYSSGRSGLSPRLVVQALDLTQKILRGTYRYSNGEEQIVLEDGKYVKINFSSSGQQECVWILNLLFYYLVQQKKFYLLLKSRSHICFRNHRNILRNWLH